MGKKEWYGFKINNFHRQKDKERSTKYKRDSEQSNH